MTDSTVQYYPIIFLFLCFFVGLQYLQRAPRPSLPPGPKPLPLIGNLLSLPPKGSDPVAHYIKCTKPYGPISSLTVMGNTIVFIHDRRVAHDLLHKKSSVTSGRPVAEFAIKMCKLDRFTAFQPYDANYRRGRKFMHQMIGTPAVSSRLYPTVEAEVRRFLVRLLDGPKEAMRHLRTSASANILKMTYGYSASGKDALTDFAEETALSIAAAFAQMGHLVDIFPAMKHIPEGLPGTEFKKTTRSLRRLAKQMIEIPYVFTQRQMAAGSRQESFVSRLMNDLSGRGRQLSPDDETIIKGAAGSLFLAGADTIVSTLTVFFLAMVMVPEAQTRGQEEVDRVIGTGRLPTMDDQDNLPYIDAIVKEALRWSPVTPLGVPHVTTQDVVQDGHRIPKGSTLIAVIWSMCHDPETYADPGTFNPARHLGPGKEADPSAVTFGFGRRVCPGRYFAEASLFLTVACTLAMFNIGKAVDELGNELEAKLEVTPGLIRHPLPFPYKITPRGSLQVERIRRLEGELSWSSDAALLDNIPPSDS
ncbi:hypothetical protein XA68_14327 [Ophiocordyceps unilateralis]|uniref:Cytochrome P450 n=1 Tax=Ophiocordyceps unilateralis TaxID=268505 RepID=A0A2A9PAW3_OPHUN|nr:hypothetical protein XA68_14327 [Ophiocordyceps unilateralis]